MDFYLDIAVDAFCIYTSFLKNNLTMISDMTHKRTREGVRHLDKGYLEVDGGHWESIPGPFGWESINLAPTLTGHLQFLFDDMFYLSYSQYVNVDICTVLSCILTNFGSFLYASFMILQIKPIESKWTNSAFKMGRDLNQIM